jgi:hypothetical protein
LMLEPTSPAGEPFGTQGQEEDKSTQNFEEVCVSLVERGWKILPKKGTYPINKQGARYINLVDPRGNRKSIRVVDPALWEKLRTMETSRSKKKGRGKPKEKVADSKPEPENGSNTISNPESEQIPSVLGSSPAKETELVTDAIAADLSQTKIVPEPAVEKSNFGSTEENVIEETPQAMQPEEKIPEKSPPTLETLARSQPELQKSIFELGLDSLISALQSDSLSPSDIIQKVQEWTDSSKNLIAFVRKSNEPRETLVHENTSEKDSLILELQTTLKETEEKLAALIQAAREI